MIVFGCHLVKISNSLIVSAVAILFWEMGVQRLLVFNLILMFVGINLVGCHFIPNLFTFRCRYHIDDKITVF